MIAAGRYIILKKTRQDGELPRRGASENHVFRAASPECVTGSATEGYMIKTQAKTTFFAQRALSASSGEAALGERVSKRGLGRRSAERSHRKCDRRVYDKGKTLIFTSGVLSTAETAALSGAAQ